MSGEFGRVGQRLRTHNNLDVTRLLRNRATTARYSNYKEDILSVRLWAYSDSSLIDHVFVLEPRA